MEKTINYFQFKRISSNRPVDTRHVNELVTKIQEKDLLHLYPIVVNANMEVIDGQHRLAAAEKLGLYIYYNVDDLVTKNDIANVNAFSKNWNINDYINFYTVENKEGFDKLSSFMLENPLMPPSTIMMMLSSGQRRDITGLKQGIIDVSNYDRALIIAGVVREYAKVYPFAYDRNFILAVMKCIYHKDYDHEEMCRKLEFQQRSCVKCISVKQYMEMFTEIYNYGNKASNHIRLV